MAIASTPQLDDYIKSRVKTPIGLCMIQTATPDGSLPANQLSLGNLLSMRITRTEDMAADTAEIAFVDNTGDYSSLNPNSKYGGMIVPGHIDTKLILYLGFQGSNFSGSTSFTPDNFAALLKFTGYVETAMFDRNPGSNVMTVSMVDLMKQFRFTVYDSFPHVIYGNQTLSYFDPTYNLKNPSGDGKTWVCEGKMFTQSATDKVYGSSHIAVQPYIDITGGGSPASTVFGGSFTFDYKNGVLSLATAIATNSVVSISGNPTAMAPEVMVRRLLVDYAHWSPNFIQLDTSGVIIPQYQGNNKPLWQVLKEIAAMTCPRIIPWVIWADENGNVKFYEQRLDSPPVKYFVNGKDILTQPIEYTSRQLQTVVRADGSVDVVQGSSDLGEQPVSAIAYDVDNMDEFGETEPLLIDQTLTQAVRNMSPVQAISYLNLLAASVLAQVSRPVAQVTADIWPDPTLQISDKVSIRDDVIGLDREFIISGMQEDITPGIYKQSLQLTEHYDTINFAMGVPGAVSSGPALQATTPAPNTTLIGAVRLGNGAGTFPFRDGAYSRNKNGDQTFSLWDGHDTSAMHFDYFINSAPATPGINPIPLQPSNYDNLPQGYSWLAAVDALGRTVFYGVDPSDSKTVYVGPDSVFYKFSHAAPITAADSGAYWTPPGNTASVALGGTQSYTGAALTVYVWSWWYMCMDSNLGSGNPNRLVMRPNASNDGVAVSVPTTGGAWSTNSWTAGPGPGVGGAYLYGNIIVDQTDFTTPPPGFVSAQVDPNDTARLGVAFGNSISGSNFYVDWRKRNRGHFCLFAAASNGARQYLRIPFFHQL